MSKKGGSSPVTIFDAAPLALGLAMLGYAGYVMALALIPDYVPVTATVIQAEERVIEHSYPRPAKYDYRIAFRYHWQGQAHVADDYTHGGRDAMEGVCAYDVGDRVTVHVDPDNPTSAVMKPGVSPFVTGMAILGLLITIHGGTSLVTQRRAEPNAPPPKALRALGRLIALSIVVAPLGYLAWTMAAPPC